MHVMTDGTDYRLRLAVRAAEQLLAHAADPRRVPMYLPCDDDELPSEHSFGSPEEEL
jgi:hypothetical protein